jgi:hypothetical protein
MKNVNLMGGGGTTGSGIINNPYTSITAQQDMNPNESITRTESYKKDCTKRNDEQKREVPFP